jgi:type II secretory pathway pseudopilin PulG
MLSLLLGGRNDRTMKLTHRHPNRRKQVGMTLAEVVISLGIGGMIFGGVLVGYMQSANRAEWSAYQLAAQAAASQRLESARASKWDTQSAPMVDMLVATNFPVTVTALDIPLIGTNIAWATNQVFISTVSANPPLKMIRVETVWSFRGRGLFTNTTATYRAPDQ